MAKKGAVKAKNIVEAAQAAGTFSTLLTAVKAADLTSTLKDKGPFTVFAPTDDAFEKVGQETIDDLLKPESRKRLQHILKHHVIRGRVDAADVQRRKSMRPMFGNEIPVRKEGNDVFLGDAKVIQTDIETGNGIIHVIDSVVLPKE
jgi:uncharacterized surface protein with fasciclin (FAS1) repeats